MGWKILLNGSELTSEITLDAKIKNIFCFINDETHAIIEKIELERLSDDEYQENDRYYLSIYTKLPHAQLAFSMRGFDETFDENSLSIFKPYAVYEMDLPDYFAFFRQVDSSFGQAIADFFTHPGIACATDNIVIKMEIFINLIRKGQITYAIEAALAEDDEDFSVIQFGRILQNAYANSNTILYMQIISFYLAIETDYEFHKQAMEELTRFCMSIDSSEFTPDEKLQLLKEKFRAALLSDDPVAARLYQELCGIDITSEPAVPMEFANPPEMVMIDTYIANANLQRQLRDQLKAAKKKVDTTAVAVSFKNDEGSTCKHA